MDLPLCLPNTFLNGIPTYISQMALGLVNMMNVIMTGDDSQSKLFKRIFHPERQVYEEMKSDERGSFKVVLW